MAEASILTALARLEGNTVVERGDGLNDLKRLLSERRNATTDDASGDDIFHQVFERLYEIVSKYKPILLKTSTAKTTRTTASSRLEVAASALRFSVELGASRIRFKTALSVLDHIVDTLPLTDGSLCQPLKSDYLKSFRILLEYPPHGEHLRPKQWQTYVDFALGCLSCVLEDSSAENDGTSSREASVAPRHDNSLSVRLSQKSGKSIGKEKSTLAQDAITALKSLTSVANARIMVRAVAIAGGVQEFLGVATAGQEEAFETLNNLIVVALAENVAFTQNLVSELIPVMRRLWSGRSVALREQMLITLFTCRPLFLAPPGLWTSFDSAVLDPLLVGLMSQYRRNEKDMLHFDDILPLSISETAYLQTKRFKPSRSSSRAIGGWLTLEVIASLIVGLSRNARLMNGSEEHGESPRKRRKIQSHLDEVLERTIAGNGLEKLASLQMILFLLDQPGLFEHEWVQGLHRLLPDLNHEDPTVQTWVFLLYSRLADDPVFRHSQPGALWLQLWDAGRRAIAVVSTTRAACHLLHVLLESQLIETSISVNLLEDTLFGSGNSGPSSLTDTSLILMRGILRSKILDSEKRFESLCLKIVGWLKSRWSLPSNLDRLHNAHVVAHVRPQLLYALLGSICGISDTPVPVEDWSPANSLYKQAVVATANRDFVPYLLSMDLRSDEAGVRHDTTPRQLGELTAARLVRLVMDFLSSQVQDFAQSWRIIAAERISNISNDIVEIVAVATTVTSAIWTRCSGEEKGLKKPPVLEEIRQMSTDLIVGHTNVDASREMASRVCACVVDVQAQLHGDSERILNEEFQIVIESTLSLSRRCMASTVTEDPDDFEFFDDDQWDSQATQSSQANISATISRIDLPICQDAYGLLARYTIQLVTGLQILKSRGIFGSTASAVVFDEILILEPFLLIGARGAVMDFLSMETGTSREDAQRLIEKLGKDFLENEAFERCEPALCFCIEVLRNLIDLWIADEDDDLAAVSFDIYDWFLNIALGKGIGSPRVLSTLAHLLDSLLLRNVSYGGEDIPSPRTSLLKILEVSDHTNQYRLAARLSHVFDKYVLTQHEAIFDDIVEKLPGDPDDKEGIAIRLYVVSYLGARWHTILRQATYHVFETVAHVPATTTLASGCISQMCKVLGLKQPRQLLQHFAPQIFYTWLSKKSLALMPFQAFEYRSLQEMAEDNIAELVGQTALRGNAHAEELVSLVGIEWNLLLTGRFAHAEAYTLASETSVPKQDRLYDGSEKLVRKELGSEIYLQRLRDCLPDIIALLVVSLQDDRGIEKALPPSNLALWQEMVDHSGQSNQLPLAQQPCFRARCLPEEINYICSRLDMRPEEIWTSALLVYLFRQLLDRARPALGPLHTCSIIRKIRIIISLAGSIAFEGYPLEMMLHSLRPYLTLFACAGDAMGIYRLLLLRGGSSLATRPSFIAGLGVAIFASLTGFITSPQESTTQESHFVATMTKAQEFRIFLGQYLESVPLQNTMGRTLQTYRIIVQHAKAITGHGNSAESTSEGQLLYSLLIDQSGQNSLLSRVHFNLSIEILCRKFSQTLEYTDDILKNDDDAALVLPILQNLVAALDLDRTFRVWAAQVIGRGFIVRGLVLERDSTTSQAENSALDAKADLRGRQAVSSYTRIVRHLVDLLWKSEYPVSTAAENTLQLIFSELSHARETKYLKSDFDDSLLRGLSFTICPCPTTPASVPLDLLDGEIGAAVKMRPWAADILTQISERAAKNPVLRFLKPLISAIPDSADALLPYCVHLILLEEVDPQQMLRERISQMFSKVLSPGGPPSHKPQLLALESLLYLRSCQLPHESNMAQRNAWLEVDLCHAAIGASGCHMWHEALLFLELHYSQAQLQTGRSSRRSLAMVDGVPVEIVSKIYENVDDPDFFYGKHQTYNLQSVLDKLEHEGASQKSLSFHSAMLDSQLRVTEHETSLSNVARTTATILSTANMQGISEAVKRYYDDAQKSPSVEDGSPRDKWDLLSSPDSSTSAPGLLSLFRKMNTAARKEDLVTAIDHLLYEESKIFRIGSVEKARASQFYSKLAVLSDARQIISAASAGSLEVICAATATRNEKLKLAEFEAVSHVLIGREAAFTSIRKNQRLHKSFALSQQQALLFEFQVTRQSLHVASRYEAAQFCLNRAMYLSELDTRGEDVGLELDVATKYDLARTLWAQRETSASIGILQELKGRRDISKQAIAITRADILTDLGHEIAEARLEKPDEVIAQYLAPAIQELQSARMGSAAGRAFHNFAAFCDMQLQDADNLDDFTRISKIRERKTEEVRELEKMMNNSKNKQQQQKLKSHWTRANNWLQLDEEEWKRVTTNRQNLILQCLENYLLSMRASDDYPNDTLRFIALWLNQAESPTANSAVQSHLSSVPTIKFAPLVNQLASRLLDVKDDFQKLLKDLLFRICSDHPFHSLYQVFATSKSKPPSGDEVAASRWTAANKLTEHIRHASTSSVVWTSVHNICVALNKVAVEPSPEKQGRSEIKKLQLRKLQGGPGLDTQITKPTSKIPPPTMNIPLRPDRDYSNVPTSTSIDPELSVATGVSAPKIATITASDGSRHKLLLKGGNDDLRQDAIMEQVFEQVSNLLKDHRTTRQRNLGIRTYKVIPLTKNSGIIEFVQDTIPLNDYLLPAHSRYYPKDYSKNNARKYIADAQTKSHDQRVRTYQTVAANFHPVMRFFFMENFLDPDDWFYKRLNYSRSTAAVSILGHVLGLGDRHGHNILLDEQTGEVVHIDLGVAFEAGRVLPVPEVVPFRLTRDLVDGMGLTGVEGVFRRCCNFTLEALRRDQEAMMTILDVLRYDPLYSWSISPLRLQKMQENNEQAAADGAAGGTNGTSTSMLANDPASAFGVVAARREETEPNEADRALTVVAKKLGKALSVEATVNELIRQATDERNLAVLYCGWAAYA